MKKSVLLIAIGFTTLTACAQKMKEADVPANVKAAFTKAYPNTNWGKLIQFIKNAPSKERIPTRKTKSLRIDPVVESKSILL